MTPALVTGLLLLLAAAAHYGRRIQRLLAISSGLNDVRSVHEEVYAVLAD